MTNNLKDLKKELKSFAKRVKDFKYTDSALISFLLTGAVGTGGLSFNLFSAEDEIKEQTKQINTSIVQLRQDFKKARTENKKLLRNTNLELIQLMEQGDHVVKSPWSSWQYGINGMYNNWQGHYKGRGDKTADVKYERDKTMGKYKYNTTPNTHTLYGNTTELGLKREPNAMIPVSASLTPLVPKVKVANVSMAVDVSNLPNFVPRTIEAPEAPQVNAPNVNISIQLTLNSRSKSSGQSVTAMQNGNPGHSGGAPISDGVFEGVTVLGGTIETKRSLTLSPVGKAIGTEDPYSDWSYTAKDVIVKNTSNFALKSSFPTLNNIGHNVQGTVSTPSGVWWREYRKNGFFQTAGYTSNPDKSPTFIMNGADVKYTSEHDDSPNTEELVHQDVHAGLNITKIEADINDSFLEFLDDFKDIETINASESGDTTHTLYNVFGNKGAVTMTGPNASFSNSYSHDTASNRVNGVIMNRGKINLNSTDSKHAVFVVSQDVYDPGSQQIFYNGDSGVVTTNSPETAMFYFNNSNPTKDNITNTSSTPPNGKTDRPMSVVNRGTMVMNGDSSVGIYQASDNGSVIHVNFSDAKSKAGQDYANTFISNPTAGVYYTAHTGKLINKIDLTNLQNGSDAEIHMKNQAIVLKNNKSAGIYIPGTKTFVNGAFSVKLQGSGVNGTSEEGSAGIYSNSSMDLQAHYIHLDGSVNQSQNNVGVYTPNNSLINLGYGRIRITGGKRNTGIALKRTHGVIHSESDMVLDGGERNTAIYAAEHNTRTGNITQDVTVRSILTDNPTKDNVFIYADNGANVKTNFASGGLQIESGISTTNPVVYDSTNPNTTGQTTGAVYAKGTKTVVDISRDTSNTFGSGKNIVITGENVKEYDTVTSKYKPTKKYTGFGLFSDGAKIIANNNTIKVTNGSTAVASINNGEVDLQDSTVYYSGEGYALYNNGGKVDLSGGTLQLDGNSIGYVNDTANPGNITFGATANNSKTTIDVLSDNVIIADLRNSTGPVTLNITNSTPTLKDQVLGGSVYINPATGITKYKYASLDGGIINISSGIDRSDSTTASDSEVFTKRLIYQNSKINVTSAGSVKANLNKAQLTAIDSTLKSPIGIAISASGNSTSNNDTQINNDGKIEVNRTDTGAGGVGLYVNYGKIHNKSNGVVEVETTNKNTGAVGIFGTNSTPIVNDGTVTVGGKKSFGILGLSYRLDNAGAIVDPSSEPFKTATTPFGTVDVTNNKTITMSDDSAIGIYVLNNSSKTTVPVTKGDVKATNSATGTITINGNNSSVGMGANNGTLTNDGKITVNGTKSAGMYGTNESDLINNGEINVAATSAKNESIGMYIDDQKSTITNTGKINVGKSSYGIFGKKVDMTSGEINVDDNGVGVYSTGPAVNLTGGKINVANNNAVGVYIADDATNPQPATVTGNVDMKVGDTDSFGYLITAKNAKTDLTTHAPNDVHIGEKSVYIYSGAPKALGGKIENYSNIVTDKNNGYGIYSSQDSINYGNIDLRSGDGNIGIYSTQGVGKNYGTITVGTSNIANKQYGIGMATGYYDETAKATSNVGTIENYGTINVSQENSVGMYAVGKGSTAINRGTINLDGKNTTGMYIDRDAVGENYGVIQTTPTANGTGIKGVVVTNGGIIKNYGTINVAGNKNMGVYVYKGSDGAATYEEYGSNTSTRPFIEGTATDQKVTGSAVVKVPPASLPSAVSISVNGVEVTPVKVNTSVPEPKAPEVTITDLTGVTTLNLATEQMDHEHTHSNAEISSLGMYVDTSGINYTQPIQGLSNLYGLTDIDLIMGTEVTKYLNAKAIQIGDNILNPYNDALAGVVSSGVTLNVNSASLTWIAQPVESKNINAPIKTVYMVKIPYTDFASENDTDTAHFLDGLEQRYGVEDIHSREKQIFNKLNSLGKGENHIFAQAVNEMKGYEYSNTQMRINSTGNALDKEFKYLHDEWRNPSKQNNKIKVFGQKDEFNTDTAGVIDYDSNAYGVAYVHEDEAVTLGNSTGWYAGAVSNRFKFKDLGKSAEQQSMIKAGLFKTMSPVKDHNGSLRWTIAGDVFGGVNNMHRKFWVVDDVFESKADYYSYGAALKTDLGYDIRLSERTHLRPYGALKMEYGRFSSVKEDRGQMNLEVKGNDYFSVKPEVGAEFKYVQPLAVRTQLSVGLSAAYENELGKLNRLNQARVRYTTADWYNLRNEKEDRHGNGKFDLNLGIDNTRFGVTVNAGYDTKGENIRGGLGFRLIY